ncbi:MAG TPA: beta-L-arabinofuranosidase domain-containing protein [Tepidisphaeraceae bacterium]|jgi:hypothetical protein
MRLGFGLLMLVAAAAGASAAAGSDVIAPAVQAFDLRDVKLLDGPFKAAKDRNGQYLLSLEPDRFLHYFRTEAGLPPKAPAYGGWESPNEGAGRCLGHYLSALSLQYRATGDDRFKRRIDYIIDELALIQAANGNGYLCAEENGKQFWADLAAGNPNALKKHRVPWYIQHKMFAGLRDAFELAGSDKAKQVLIRLADWAISVTAKLDDAAFQTMLEQEHGGMREVLCDVYAITGEQKYLDLASRFYHRKVVDPLPNGQDDLPGLHANTQIPKIIGEARWYELTGEPEHQRAARFFWDRVVHGQTYANGGNSDGERFGRAGLLHLSNTTSETCNTYNMLKLTRHLFEWEPRVEYADYAERALYNHILASLGPAPGNFTYYVPMKSGHFRTFSEPAGSFWCCVGTGMENHTKYAQSIYYHDAHSLYVNLFIPSELSWNGLTVRQETDYPVSGRVSLTLSGRMPASLALRLRYPGWAGKGLTIRVNGEPVQVTSLPGSYATIDRPWKSGDRVEMDLPLSLRTEPLAGSPDRVAVLYGPLLLCGQLAPVDPQQELLGDNPTSGGDDPAVPALSVAGRPVEQWIVPVPGAPLTFQTHDAGLPAELTLVPFYKQTGRRYVVYWSTAHR